MQHAFCYTSSTRIFITRVAPTAPPPSLTEGLGSANHAVNAFSRVFSTFQYVSRGLPATGTCNPSHSRGLWSVPQLTEDLVMKHAPSFRVLTVAAASLLLVLNSAPGARAPASSRRALPVRPCPPYSSTALLLATSTCCTLSPASSSFHCVTLPLMEPLEPAFNTALCPLQRGTPSQRIHT